jgi:hypothetical protein
MQRRVEAVLQMEWDSKKAAANQADNALKFISEGGRAPVALIQQEGETEHTLVWSTCRFSIRSAVGRQATVGVGAFCSMRFCRFSSAQNSGGMVVCMELTLARTCASVCAPTINAAATSGAAEN